jgi:hypothetical protein
MNNRLYEWVGVLYRYTFSYGIEQAFLIWNYYGELT